MSNLETKKVEDLVASLPGLEYLIPTYDILIPKKVKSVMQWVEKLDKIHKDRDTAIEMCLWFLSMLPTSRYSDDITKKELNSEVLNNIFGKKYTAIVDTLLTGTKNGPIIGKGESYSTGDFSTESFCISYWLTERYAHCGRDWYTLNSEHTRNIKRSQYYKSMANGANNVIVRNVLNFYSEISLPTPNEALTHGKELSKNKFCNKKGHKLTIRNRKPDSYWKDFESRTFIEDAVETYCYITERGLINPKVGNERSGGRVVDSIVLMSSWIRSLIKINGETLIEKDFKALHPNLIVKIYGGSTRYITHQNIADECGISNKEVKLEHLSFFNKKWEHMQSSPLFSYYLEKEPEMMENIKRDKYTNGHSITSRKTFAMEVTIMTECIKILNEAGVYVGYGYDALYTNNSNSKIVEDIMNTVAKEFGIYTTV